jgi:hypothetical protein
MNIRTTVRLPEELLGRAKQKAAKDGNTLTKLIEDGLRNMLVQEKRTSAAKLPRVSTARGKALVDVSSNVRMFDAVDEGVPFEKQR